jgi:hypothetical protein
MKARQAAYPGLTLTGMYNVLEKLRGGDLRSPSINGDGTSPPSTRRTGGVIWRSRHKTPRHKTQDKRNCSPASSPSTTSARRKSATASSAGSARNTSVGAISGRPPPRRKPPTSPAPRSRFRNPKSTINNQQSTILNQIPCPPGLAAQFAEIQKLLPATGANAMAISAFFGKRSKPRESQIAEILETLRSLGKLE